MPWARLDDAFHDHPKVDGVSLAAIGLYTLCLTWAHRHRRTAVLPGHITEGRVAKVAGKQGPKLAAELVTAGLWETETDLGGYLIHDFADYLPKERDPVERAEAGRKGAASKWQGHSKRDGKQHGKPDSNLPANSMASDSSRASARAYPTRPEPVPEEQPTTDPSSSPESHPPDNDHDDDQQRQADDLLDATGPWTAALRADLEPHVLAGLTDFEPAGIKAALADFHSRLGDPRTRPGLLPYLIQQHAARLQPDKPTRRPWCGNCEEATRLLLDDNRDPVGPCPECKP